MSVQNILLGGNLYRKTAVKPVTYTVKSGESTAVSVDGAIKMASDGSSKWDDFKSFTLKAGQQITVLDKFGDLYYIKWYAQNVWINQYYLDAIKAVSNVTGGVKTSLNPPVLCFESGAMAA